MAKQEGSGMRSAEEEREREEELKDKEEWRQSDRWKKNLYLDLDMGGGEG